MGDSGTSERVQVVVIGGGQAGLSVGFCLARLGLSFVILEANPRVGDSWRKRWDSLRLFTPAKYDGLIGLPFPAPAFSFPTKDEMADYLETYAKHFDLPVRTGVSVDRVWRDGARYIVDAGDRRVRGRSRRRGHGHVPETPRPGFCPSARSRHRPTAFERLQECEPAAAGDVLIVGAGNSGADIAMDVGGASRLAVWAASRPRAISHRRPHRARRSAVCVSRHLSSHSDRGHADRTASASVGHLERRPADSREAGGSRRSRRERAPRVTGVRDGRPLLADGRMLDVNNVIWCTGFHPGLSWIDLPHPVYGSDGEPIHERGVVPAEPGFYFVGLHFLYALSSTMIHGVARDAERIANVIDQRVKSAAAARTGAATTAAA